MLGNVQWPMVSAIAASIGVIVALVFYVLNLRVTRLSNSAKMVLDLRAMFNSVEMRKHRRHFARLLLDRNSPPDLLKDAPVPEFFEQIGFMTRRKVLDKGMVWNSFSWWLEYYYVAVTRERNLIAEARSQIRSPLVFREIEWLYKQMCAFEMKEEGEKEHIPPSSEDVVSFLEEESRLDLVQK